MIAKFIRNHPIISFFVGLFVLFFVIIYSISLYENTTRLKINEGGDVACSSSGKYREINKGACILMSKLQGDFFWESQRKLALKQLEYKESNLVAINLKKINLLKSELNTEVSNINSIYDKLIPNKLYEIKKIEAVLEKHPNDSDQIEKLKLANRQQELMLETKNLDLKMVIEKYDEKISILQNEINNNPNSISSLKKIISKIDEKIE